MPDPAPAARLAAVLRHLTPAAGGGAAARSSGEPRFTRLHPVLGAQVEGVDLKRPLSAAEVRRIRRLWGEANGILVFKGQHLSEAELKAFAASFGHVLQHPFINGAKIDAEHPEHVEIMTIGGRAKNDSWHADMTWMRHPPKATILQCVQRSASMETPPTKGDTMFCSMTNAYDMLSPGLQRTLEGMTARHGVQDLMGRYDEDTERREYPNGLGVKTTIENEHPCVIVHPVTKRRSLYVNNWPCKRFTGMTQEETAPLKRLLNEVASREDNVYRHQWSVGDVVMIDQRCTMHYAVRDYDDKRDVRVMRRATITDAGAAPGVDGVPRPVGVTGRTGDEMGAVADIGGSPRTYRGNVTMLRGSWGQRGSGPAVPPGFARRGRPP